MKGLEQLLKDSNNHLRGIAAAPGLVIGRAFIFKKETLSIKDDIIENVDQAVEQLWLAIAQSKKELNKIFSLAKEKMGEKRAQIFEAQLMMLDDPIFLQSLESRIKTEKRDPQFVVFDETSKVQNMLTVSDEQMFKERAEDIEDIKMRIIRNLQKRRWESKIEQEVIVVSEILTPADTILFAKNKTLGYVTNEGGLTSHAAIVARSLNIPAIVGAEDATDKIKTGDILAIDGFHGIVVINPTDVQLEYFNKKIEHLKEINEAMSELLLLPAQTTDGEEITLQANVDVTGEIAVLKSNGAKGIGLFRSEQIIEELGEFPDEEQQHHIYKELAIRVYPDQITIRAFDLGGDKVRLFHHSEANPFLGLRGVRFLLDNRSLFKSQIRAVLRASTHKNIKFMIPMISTIQEIRESKRLIQEVMDELTSKGIKYDSNIPVGIMIEVPAAAVMARQMAKEVDFLSIGTNDLIQYLMAVDRGNNTVSSLYQEFNPAVLQSLFHIIENAKIEGKDVSMCGEMAADTLATPFLVGAGLRSFSVSPSAIPSLKRTIRSFPEQDARTLVSTVLQLSSQEEILTEIELFFQKYSITRTRNIL